MDVFSYFWPIDSRWIHERFVQDSAIQITTDYIRSIVKLLLLKPWE